MLDGQQGNDDLQGDEGNDVLEDDQGDNIEDGGTGDDTYVGVTCGDGSYEQISDPDQQAPQDCQGDDNSQGNQ